jgi:hypothetical protein
MIMKKQINQDRQVNNPRKDPSTSSKPDVRDNLDSRKNEEQSFKGSDVTHNEKETKEEKLKEK